MALQYDMTLNVWQKSWNFADVLIYGAGNFDRKMKIFITILFFFFEIIDRDCQSTMKSKIYNLVPAININCKPCLTTNNTWTKTLPPALFYLLVPLLRSVYYWKRFSLLPVITISDMPTILQSNFTAQQSAHLSRVPTNGNHVQSQTVPMCSSSVWTLYCFTI